MKAKKVNRSGGSRSRARTGGGGAATPREAGSIEGHGALLRVSMPWDAAIEARMNGLLDAAGERLTGAQRSPNAGYEASVLAWDDLIGDLEEIGSRASWTFNTSPSAPDRDRAEKTNEFLPKLWSRLFTLRLPYDVLSGVQKRLGASLAWDRQAYLKDLLRAFELSGVHLDPVRKTRVNAIDNELSEIGTRFAKALKDRDVPLEITEAQAKPLEAGSVRRDAKTGKLELLLRENTYHETMRNHPDRAFRKKVFDCYFRATADLAGLLDRMRKLRRERSGLVANRSYASIEAESEGFTLTEVRGTLDELVSRTTKRFRETMQDYRQMNGGERPLPHDLAYLEEHAESDGLDPSLLREYFSAERTIKVLLELSEQLYGLNFRRTAQDRTLRTESWEVAGASGKTIGQITFDLHPRPGKFSHAACWTLRGRASRLPDRTAEVGLVCNFKEKTLPGGAKGLNWDDVNTCFHEYGHVLHGLLINAEPLGAHSVPRSLVEVPSQVFELWAYDPAVLDRLARHYKTGKPLTEPLRRLLYGRHQRFAARGVRQQVLYGRFDLEFHEHTEQDPQEIWERLSSDIFGPGFYPPGLPWFTRFGHLDGYGAKYWGYKFADIGKSQMYWYIVHRYRDLVSHEAGDRLVVELLRFGGLKKLSQTAREFTGVPLTGVPYILETLYDYPALRETMEKHRDKPFREAIEAAFRDLAKRAQAPRAERRQAPGGRRVADPRAAR